MQFSNSLLVVLSVFLLVILLVWIAKQRRKSIRLRHFRGRVNLHPEKIYEDFFLPKGVDKGVFTEVWREISDAYQISQGLLRPSDQFSLELAPIGNYEPFNDEMNYLAESIEEICEMNGYEMPNINQFKTIGDLVTFFGNVENNHQKSQPS